MGLAFGGGAVAAGPGADEGFQVGDHAVCAGGAAGVLDGGYCGGVGDAVGVEGGLENPAGVIELAFEGFLGCDTGAVGGDQVAAVPDEGAVDGDEEDGFVGGGGVCRWGEEFLFEPDVEGLSEGVGVAFFPDEGAGLFADVGPFGVGEVEGDAASAPEVRPLCDADGSAWRVRFAGSSGFRVRS
ncbi:hypothetical protein HW450_12930 [Corynebacterium hindlerae]|uniref:Uncharacterized protein n=1 Tax=Corynebacterium hindlerae TaxID=699041 RepID=A0A7G5FIX1_9CORY|nr:hypothetical protein [Corynebacterium hindlerae]QMV86562.1 hypothetical protein HW450_12930 [Corynebacterium hindlerae]